MAKQSDYERINRLIIAPMVTTWQVKVPEGMIDGYVEDLSPYNDQTLAAAFREVRRTSKTPPRIAHFVDACRNIAGAGSVDTTRASDYFAGIRRSEEDLRSTAKRFMDGYEACGLMDQAKAEGWAEKLRAYAYEAAYLQAQFMANVKNAGFSQSPFANWRNVDTEKRCRDFVTSCRSQARTGTIEVSVPSYLIDEWRARRAA